MKKINLNLIITSLSFFMSFGVMGCSSDSSSDDETIDPTPEVEKTLSVDKTQLTYVSAESTQEISVTTNVDTWVISSSGTEWISLSETSGASGTTKINISVTANSSIKSRSAVVTVNANGVSAVKITIDQEGTSSTNGIYPDYNTNPIAADASGMESTAQEIAAKISLGWNLGNTLEATGGETAWGNPMATKALIDLVKANGFNAVRIPCAWDQYLEDIDNAKIKASWLDRVKEVVQYCIDNDMYVVLNIHWDGGWLELNVNEESKTQVNAKQKAYWEQIATHFRDYDERLLFASANEPHVETAEEMAVLNSYHQTFIDAVRATGGRNAYRTLVVQGPATDVEKTYNLMTTLPVDTAVDRMMAEVHYYTPYQFALMTEDQGWGRMFYYWGAANHSTTDTDRNSTWGEESTVDDMFDLVKTQFVDKGIPVIMGEYAAIKRTNLTGEDLQLHLASRHHFLEYVTREAIAHGLLPFYWDAGNMGDNASALFNRSNNTVYDQEALDAILRGLN